MTFTSRRLSVNLNQNKITARAPNTQSTNADGQSKAKTHIADVKQASTARIAKTFTFPISQTPFTLTLRDTDDKHPSNPNRSGSQTPKGHFFNLVTSPTNSPLHAAPLLRKDERKRSASLGDLHPKALVGNHFLNVKGLRLANAMNGELRMEGKVNVSTPVAPRTKRG